MYHPRVHIVWSSGPDYKMYTYYILFGFSVGRIINWFFHAALYCLVTLGCITNCMVLHLIGYTTVLSKKCEWAADSQGNIITLMN